MMVTMMMTTIILIIIIFITVIIIIIIIVVISSTSSSALYHESAFLPSRSRADYLELSSMARKSMRNMERYGHRSRGSRERREIFRHKLIVYFLPTGF